MSQRVLATGARIMYAHGIYEAKAVTPGQTPRFSCQLLVPNNDPCIAQIQAAEAAVLAQRWPGGAPANMKPLPWYSGDDQKYWTKDPNGSPVAPQPAYQGMIVLQCGSVSKPPVCDPQNVEVMQEDYVYSGCYVDVGLGVYGYGPNPSSGITFGIDAVRFNRDGERMDGRPSIADVFGAPAGAPPATAAGVVPGPVPGAAPVPQGAASPAGYPTAPPVPPNVLG